MKKLVLMMCFMSCIHFVFAQQITARVQGTPILNEVTNNVEGSPYLYADFKMGALTLAINSITLTNVMIKYNALKESIIYRDEKGQELMAATPIKSFKIENSGKVQIFQNGFPKIDQWTPDTYYEVLNTNGGLPMILKKYAKTLLSRREYNSSKVTDAYLDAIKYYVFSESGTMTKFKADKKSILTYFPNKQTEISAYIAKNGIDLKDDGDLGKVFDYYSSIK